MNKQDRSLVLTPARCAPRVPAVPYKHRGEWLREMCEIHHRQDDADRIIEAAVKLAFERVESTYAKR